MQPKFRPDLPVACRRGSRQFEQPFYAEASKEDRAFGTFDLTPREVRIGATAEQFRKQEEFVGRFANLRGDGTLSRFTMSPGQDHPPDPIWAKAART
jgi:hypothetical protein